MCAASLSWPLFSVWSLFTFQAWLSAFVGNCHFDQTTSIPSCKALFRWFDDSTRFDIFNWPTDAWFTGWFFTEVASLLGGHYIERALIFTFKSQSSDFSPKRTLLSTDKALSTIAVFIDQWKKKKLKDEQIYLVGVTRSKNVQRGQSSDKSIVYST